MSRANEQHSIYASCSSFWTRLSSAFPISHTQSGEFLCWLSLRQSECQPPFRGRLMCGEILTQNGRHESPRRTDRLLTDEVPPLLLHLRSHSHSHALPRVEFLCGSHYNAIRFGAAPRLVISRQFSPVKCHQALGWCCWRNSLTSITFHPGRCVHVITSFFPDH